MSIRITDATAVQGAAGQLLSMERYLHQSGLDHNLLELVKYRISQINHCAYCLSLHARTLREAGEREDRLHVLPAWRETDWFSDRERAALAWAEAVTALEGHEVPDAVWQQVQAAFGEKEIADLTLAIITINGWNRANIALHMKGPAHFEIIERQEAAAD